jgi:subtilisin family serine protease
MQLLTSASAAARSLAPAGIRSLETDAAGRAVLWQQLTTTSLRGGIDHVWLDGQRKLSLDVSVPQIGAPAAWKAGLDGAGVTVAVLDSGIDATHPDLKDQISQARNFTTVPDTDDTVGHGTHVASTIAGTGAASGGRYRGVAPGAKLLVGKVCTDVCEDSDILAGMAWAARLHRTDRPGHRRGHVRRGHRRLVRRRQGSQQRVLVQPGVAPARPVLDRVHPPAQAG